MLLEDDENLNRGIALKLQKEGYQVFSAFQISEAEKLFDENRIDLVISDITLPDGNGLEFCRKIRNKSKVFVLFLTAMDSEIDMVNGYDAGADDYITKPFNILEVKARIKAIMRRSSKRATEDEKKKIFEKNGLKIDCDSRRVFVEDKEVKLTAKEYDLLELLSFHPNKVYSRENLLNIVWGYDYPGDVRTVDVHIRRLREKIEKNPGEPLYIHTKWGVGYYFQD